METFRRQGRQTTVTPPPLDDPPAIPAHEPATTRPRRKLRFSFSLLTFLLVISLILTVISHVRTSRLLENYRESSDELEIESHERIHVRRMKLTNHVVWRWRVFLPEGQTFCLRTATKGVRDDKLPSPETGRLFDASGEVFVDVFAHHVNGEWWYHVTIMTGYGGGGSVTTVAAQLKLAADNYPFAFEELAKERTQSFAVGQPVVLLRGWNAFARHADPASEPGIIVWIETEPPP